MASAKSKKRTLTIEQADGKSVTVPIDIGRHLIATGQAKVISRPANKKGGQGEVVVVQDQGSGDAGSDPAGS